MNIKWTNSLGKININKRDLEKNINLYDVELWDMVTLREQDSLSEIDDLVDEVGDFNFYTTIKKNYRNG